MTNLQPLNEPGSQETSPPPAPPAPPNPAKSALSPSEARKCRFVILMSWIAIATSCSYDEVDGKGGGFITSTLDGAWYGVAKLFWLPGSAISEWGSREYERQTLCGRIMNELWPTPGIVFNIAVWTFIFWWIGNGIKCFCRWRERRQWIVDE